MSSIKIPKGWVYNSTTSDYEYQVYDSTGAVKTMFNEDGSLFQGGTKITATAAQLNGTGPVLTTPQINDTTADHQYVFAVSELAADRTVTLPLLLGNDEFVFKDFIQTLTNKTLTAPAIAGGVLSGTFTGVFTQTVTSASTSGSTSVEPFVVSQTMTGAGGVGGRSRFQLDTNVALGGWSNALKGIAVYGATGKTTGLGSAVCAEMTLSAGTVDGNYAPLEIELNLGAGAKTGTSSAFIYASAQGAALAEFDTYGHAFDLEGITIDTGHLFQASAKSAINATHALRIKVAGTAYFIPCHTSAAFGV